MVKITRSSRVDERFEEMRRQIEMAREKSRTYQGPCEACRWFRSGLLEDVCEHPVVDAVAFNINDHYHKKRIVECAEQRDIASIYGEVVCGPEGLLFEEKLSWFQRLMGARYHDGGFF